MDIIDALMSEQRHKFFSDYIMERKAAASEITRLREENKVMREVLIDLAKDEGVVDFTSANGCSWVHVDNCKLIAVKTALASTGGE